MKTVDAKIESAREEKRTVLNRLKEYRRDVSVLLKYADDKQQKKIQELGFDLSEPERGLNPVATIALDIVMNAQDHTISNGELYTAYTKTLDDGVKAVSYTEFNIKCRSLFNTGRLQRTKGNNLKNSREDIISFVKTE